MQIMAKARPLMMKQSLRFAAGTRMRLRVGARVDGRFLHQQTIAVRRR